MSLFRKPIFSFSLFPRVIDGCLPFILYIIYYIQDYFLYYILVCLSKVFQRTIFSFKLPFQRESVCKGKAFFRNLQIFSKVFFEKIFGRFSEGVRLILSRSLAHPQGKILGAAVSTIFHSPSFTQSVIFSGSPSRKRLQRYRLFPFPQLLHHTFFQYFFRFLSNSLIYFMLYSIIFIAM